MATKVKNKPKLEDYSKEVLVAFIKRHFFWNFEELEQAKKEVETAKLMIRMKEIIAEKSKLKLHTARSYHKWLELTEEFDLVNKKLDELLNIEKVK